MEESFQKMEELKAKVVPLCADKRAEAKELFKKLQLACSLRTAMWSSEDLSDFFFWGKF